MGKSDQPIEVKVGDIVGISEVLLYTGVGVVKEHDRGIVYNLSPERKAAWVLFPDHIGRLFIHTKDLIIYGRIKDE